MSSTRIRELVEDFVSKLDGVLRESWKEDLQRAIENIGVGAGAGGRRASGRSAPLTAISNGHSLKGAVRSKGTKRDSAELEALSGKLLSFVAKNPGLRVEQINKQLGTTTKDLTLPIRKLIADGELKAHGQKRSTTYSVGGGRKRAKK